MMIKKASQSSRSPRVPKKPRLTYIEVDNMRSGTKRRTIVKSQPKRGYTDSTTTTSRSGTVVSSRNGKITKIKVVDRSAAKKKANPRPRTGNMR